MELPADHDRTPEKVGPPGAPTGDLADVLTVPLTVPLTARQDLVLAELRRLTESHGFPPTLRELGRALGISSTNGVFSHLEALERKGYIRRSGPKSRSVVLLCQPQETADARGATGTPDTQRMREALERIASFDGTEGARWMGPYLASIAREALGEPGAFHTTRTAPDDSAGTPERDP